MLNESFKLFLYSGNNNNNNKYHDTTFFKSMVDQINNGLFSCAKNNINNKLQELTAIFKQKEIFEVDELAHAIDYMESLDMYISFLNNENMDMGLLEYQLDRTIRLNPLQNEKQV